MPIPSFTEAAIRQHATAESFRRGEDYYNSGAVVSLIQRGDTIEAEVEGSQYEPYQVQVTFDAGGITDASCTCPYDWGGWCKHIVATLLACIEEPEEIEARPPLAELLAGLSRDQLQALVATLAEGHPGLTDAIESQVTVLQAAPPPAPPSSSSAYPFPSVAPRHTPVDPQPFRRQVRHIFGALDGMRSSEAYWHVGEVAQQVGELVDQAQKFTEAGDGRNALTILEAITDEYLDHWTELDDSDGDASSFFEDLAAPWAEAILTADSSTTLTPGLTPAEREQWARKLAEWQADLDDYGMEEVFEAARLAAEQGWDYPPLVRAMAGEITELGAWEDEDVPSCADDLTLARLAVLERQGRLQEYLYLAEAEGQTGLHLTMLAKVGRVQEAIEEGLRYLSTTEDAFMLARALREKGELAGALRIAEHGLTLEGQKAELAAWASDLATGLGETQRGLDAGLIAFREAPSQAGYRKIQELAGEGWLARQAELLDFLRRASSYFAQDARVEIFLHEGLLDDAIAVVRDYAGYGLLERVMDAAIEKRPDWVIEAACKQAERIVDAGKANQYEYAVGWLKRARAAYRAAGREAEWRAYLAGIRARPGRKYKLMGLLDGMT
jgi:uncharacterized Zn finger protein